MTSTLTTADLIATINTQIDAALADLHAATPKARTRRVNRDDYTAALVRAFSLVADGDVNVTLSIVGGYVSNNYGHGAEADRVTVSVDLIAGAPFVWAARNNAPARPHGKGPLHIVHLARAGQRHGRCVSW